MRTAEVVLLVVLGLALWCAVGLVVALTVGRTLKRRSADPTTGRGVPPLVEVAEEPAEPASPVRPGETPAQPAVRRKGSKPVAGPRSG